MGQTISNDDVEHRAFVEAYGRGEVRMGFRRTRVHATMRTPYRELFKAAPDYPAMLNTFATAASALIILCIIAGMTLPFVAKWWLAAPCAGLALAFSALSYRFQREAIRELALSSPTAYKFLVLDGILVLDKQESRDGSRERFSSRQAEAHGSTWHSEKGDHSVHQGPLDESGAEPAEPPPNLVLQIARHWETYRPRMSREMKEAGTFDACVREAALMTSDATYDLITKHGLAPDQARELMREEWAFLPEEEDSE